MIANTEPTKRQRQVLDFIAQQVERHGFPPTITEIQKHFFFKSPNAVQQHLKALARKGLLKRHSKKSRGLEISRSRWDRGTGPAVTQVPLVGRIAAGTPIFAEENIEATLAVDGSLVRARGKLFALKVLGQSMVNAGIHNGDIVIARQQASAQNGEIVVALIGNEATVKRLFITSGTIILRPENETMAEITVAEREDFRILGKVVASLRRLEG